MEYPKLNTLFKRYTKDDAPRPCDVGKVDPSTYRSPELGALAPTTYRWNVEEKVNGMNIRVMWDADGLRFGGRTDKALLPAELVNHLQATFTEGAMQDAFEHSPNSVVLFGEGYGPGIQKGGTYRKEGQRFCLFDVLVWNPISHGTWLDREAVASVAEELGVVAAPYLGMFTAAEAVELVHDGLPSNLAARCALAAQAEGVVARAEPLLLDRHGRRIMFKLKHKDFSPRG